MTIICTEEQKKEIINAQFCPTIKCKRYSREYGAQYETCEQCREETIKWIIERPQEEIIKALREQQSYCDFDSEFFKACDVVIEELEKQLRRGINTDETSN